MKFIEESIDNIQTFTKDTLMSIKSAVNLVTQNNLIFFKDKFYRETEGNPMRSTFWRLNPELKLMILIFISMKIFAFAIERSRDIYFPVYYVIFLT